ncbi:MAG: DUF4911 domain-containing protein [Bdellovibrionales bacterium]|nr:DUF4911 domain-containing protein [Bdellovibrionales bacterium]
MSGLFPKSSQLDLDDHTTALFLEVPGPKVVVLQGFFELYEGLGLVRTIDIKKSQVAILVTKDLLQESIDALESIKEEVCWKPGVCPPDITADNYFAILHRS